MVQLIPFSAVHFATLASWFTSETDLVQWAGPTLTFPIDKAEFQAMIEQGQGPQPARLCWMAEAKGALVGHVQLAFDWRNGNATLGRVAVAPAARGRGLAQPMVRLALEQAFARPGIERVELNVYPFNRPAIRTYRSLGFAQEGIRRASARVGEARWDTVIMGLLRAEWPDPPTV